MACLASPPWTSCGLLVDRCGHESFRKGYCTGTSRLRSHFVVPCEVRGSLRRSPRSGGVQAVENGEGIRVMAEMMAEKTGEEVAGEGGEEVVVVERNVDLTVTNLGNNTRRVEAKIAIQAPLEAVWGVLTDYDNLADHIPGLAESRVLELRPNGARLLQIGQKNLALGVKFKAKAIVEVVEEAPRDLDDGTLRDISFVTVEGDFQVFKGVWRMHQTCGNASSETKDKTETWLSYILEVQPKRWMPVALIEGVLGHEITCNLISVRNVALRNNSREEL
ncbi:hypothetical protein KC19_5G074300 [Ceratodon purpureus]|uniref:Coenzyme Q-binding protein COQ10 START domain-containing protein n=1 Tax=Ceratodon purpureus TaxID=3225 RepID=A0A8T0I142_CERPU|nr:hypothetical protein KC19_5G074300 [Ceratodon purpureus]